MAPSWHWLTDKPSCRVGGLIIAFAGEFRGRDGCRTPLALINGAEPIKIKNWHSAFYA
ncbi:hypothetical protein C9427_27475 [Mesorhizobium helmanticense]|uniref:Uncharacterized protein n=1 Tax=Mesorhizobium helmanticense TaxID=1776423 RepID=A0A2T4INL3_9HYPH|nr:hypothetical protein C9427_27475 [Mesorhizobium helmanticense]